MKALKITSLIASLILGSSVFATNIVVTNFSTTTPADSHPTYAGGSLIPSGSGIVLAGVFSVLPTFASKTSISQSELATLIGAFQTFGTAAVPNTALSSASRAFGGTQVNLSGTFPKDGLFKVTYASNPPSAADALVGRDIYVLLGNGATIATSTAVALVKSGTIQAPAVTSATSNIGAAMNADFLLGQLGSTSVIYSAPATGALVGQSLTALNFATVVPEPSSLLALVCGGLGLYRRRR
jgi:hypothetical protein